MSTKYHNPKEAGSSYDTKKDAVKGKVIPKAKAKKEK